MKTKKSKLALICIVLISIVSIFASCDSSDSQEKQSDYVAPEWWTHYTEKNITLTSATFKEVPLVLHQGWIISDDEIIDRDESYDGNYHITYQMDWEDALLKSIRFHRVQKMYVSLYEQNVPIYCTKEDAVKIMTTIENNGSVKIGIKNQFKKDYHDPIFYGCAVKLRFILSGFVTNEETKPAEDLFI